MALELWNPTEISYHFNHLFLTVYGLPLEWMGAFIIILTWLYVIKEGGIEKGLWLGLPLFLFGAGIMWAIFQVQSLKVTGMLLILYVFVWIIYTRFIQKI